MSDLMGTFAADLLAAEPHPARDLSLFGQFVGEWSMRVRLYERDGSCGYDEPGRWTFGWVLDGRAIQDVLTGPAPGTGSLDAGDRRIGSSMRMLDPATGVWNVVWFGVSGGAFVVLHGGADGDGILLESEPEADGTLNQWRFDGITDDAFRWEGRESLDGGSTWFVRQRMEGVRMT